MKEILLSTDIGTDIDDALSLLTMLRHPEVKINGIYATVGDVASRCCIAKHMVMLSGQDIPVAKGESTPLGTDASPYEIAPVAYLVDDIYIDGDELMSQQIIYKSLQEIGVAENGVEHLAKQLTRGPQDVLSQAPLTNIAVLLRDYPSAARNISTLYMMGCRLNGQLEHNVRFDSVAAQMVFSSNIPIVVIPGDVCERYRPKFMQMQIPHSKVGLYVDRMLKAFVGAKIVGQCRSSGLDDLLMATEMSPSGRGRLTIKELDRLSEFKRIFLVNFDEHIAYLDRDFWPSLYKLIHQLDNPEHGYSNGRLLARLLRQTIEEQEVSIADVYVPYCLLHPDHTERKRMNLSCGLDGSTIVAPGSKHEVVTEIDLSDFQSYLQKYLY